MSFLHPWAFGLAGLVPIIVLLYLLKVRRRAVTVSTLLFWEKVLQENRRRALFQRLRQWWSLLLHLLIFALVLLALARPEGRTGLREGSALVLVLDARARMQALEPGGETRFALALREAERFTRLAGPRREMAILSAAEQPAVAVPFTGDEKTLREGLDRLRPSDGGGDLAAALRLGRELLASRRGERRLVVITDGALPEAGDAEVVSVGTPRDNVAITQFAARSLPGEVGTSEVLLQLANFSRATARGNVSVALAGRALDVRPFELAPGAQTTRTFPLSAPATSAARLTASLDTHDALPLDDTASATLPARAPLRVLLVSAGNWFLEKLLQSDARVKFELLTPESFSPALLAGFQAVIFDDFIPPGTTLAHLPAHALFVGRGPFDSGAADLAQPLVTESDAASPLLRAVSLDHVSVSRSRALGLPPEPGAWHFEAPLRFGEAPLLLVGVRPAAAGEERVAELGFRVADSDLPLRVAFPLLISNLLQWLGDQPPDALPASARDPAESDLRAAGGGPLAPAAAPLLPARIATAWPLWQYLVLAALMLCAMEWWLFHSRRTE